MGLDALYREVMEINVTDDKDKQKEAAKAFFDKLNFMDKPEYFNWAEEIFEGLHVKERGDKTALFWASLVDDQERSLTYSQMATSANKLLNLLRKNGVAKGDNVYMMIPIVPETWIVSLAAVKGGLVAVPTATSMTVRELKFRFEAYPPDVIIVDEASLEPMNQALADTGCTPKVKLIVGSADGWTSFADIQSEADQAEAAKTKSDDTLICFFTSGTTGLPKLVGQIGRAHV